MLSLMNVLGLMLVLDGILTIASHQYYVWRYTNTLIGTRWKKEGHSVRYPFAISELLAGALVIFFASFSL
jgi:hypothetical protein